ncbi:MAG TPA: serine hydrolase domain-containing protein [Verrucomicrobiae bacterium]|nr:serine hydrolase domain-containing protein [Verrucomicrobiae bacterium]
MSVTLAAASRDLPRGTPEEQGVSSTAILKFIEAANKIDAMHSVMIVRHGHVIAEGWWAPFNAASQHMLYSLSKSFTSTAVGLAIAEGKLSLDDTVLSFFPEDAPATPGDNLKSMRVRDLLEMSTGHHADDLNKFSFNSTERLTKAFLALPVAHKPGTHFLYNTPATYMLSAIVQKVTGQPIVDYLGPRLFEPLGIEHPVWQASAQGISLGGYGLSVRTGDIAAFGQLYLQKGKWQGKQLLPASWVEAATTRQTSNGSSPTSDWDQGYCYQFWRCRHNCYRGDGAFGQYCIVMPDQDAVVAITSGVRDMQAVMNLVWEHLLPAMQPKRLSADRDSQAKLRQTLAGLVLPTVTGNSVPGPTFTPGRKFTFPSNDQKLESIVFENGGKDGPLTLVARVNGATYRIVCGAGKWEKSRFAYGQLPEGPVAASGAWTSEDTCQARIWFYETPYCLTLTAKFSPHDVVVNPQFNVSFGPAKQSPLTGRLE